MSTTQANRKRKSQLPKLISKYYDDLKELAHQNVLYEMGTRPAFHALLLGAGREHGWTLIAEHSTKVNGKTIRPDGTFKDTMNLVRGMWEAKDTADDLDREIDKKIKAGYPLKNIIFEDNATAILYQNGYRIQTAAMSDETKLASLITTFFNHTEPQIQQFELAVDEFKERVPDLAEGLKQKIDQAHKTNKAFKQAFADFFELCKTSLNPNIAQAAVDEMLIQHILTERLIREIFDNPEFVRRNVIAAEVEKVMQAMTSQSFDRNTYLRELDRFYIAIENAARTMTDFSDKQHFLNTVYERFFQGYSVKLADTMGIVYTPQEIVDFMCASVEEVLKNEFGKTLASDDVYIIDPCTGTGNFIVNLIRRIPKAKLEEVYRHRLFANEIMLLPYYIAALNIEHAYYEQTGTYEPFEGLCFVDTLDLAEHEQAQLGFMTAANTARVERQKRTPINIVIGNPPYNTAQKNENDGNRNRKYDVVDRRISATYVRESSATLRMQLYDPYVRFFRWAVDRLEGRDGIVAFVTNNSFVDQLSFDGMRKHFAEDFSRIYHVDLHGNVRLNPKLSGTTHNVFGIQVGVGITIAVRKKRAAPVEIAYFRMPEDWRREQKLGSLAQAGAVGRVAWQSLRPDQRGNWLKREHTDEFAKLFPLGSKDTTATQAAFAVYGCGVASNGDVYVYDHQRAAVLSRAQSMAEDFNVQVDRWKRTGQPDDLDAFLKVDPKVHKWIRNTKRTLKRGNYVSVTADDIRPALYRPFSKQYYLFHRAFNEDTYRFPQIFPRADSANVVMCLSDIGYRANHSSVLMTDAIADLHVCATSDRHQCFPFYIYDEDGKRRRENITDWTLKQFQEHYKDSSIDKWNIFYYVYGLLHHPGYREKFADNLKRDLPRIPFAPDFCAFSNAGRVLADLHLNYESLKPYDLQFIEAPAIPLSYRVDDKMRLSKDKTQLVVNKSLTLAGIPPETFEYRLGNRSALEWVIDQYQVHTDPRSNITSDPNREDDPEYIVRLVGQVIKVSIETMKSVRALPDDFSEPGTID